KIFPVHRLDKDTAGLLAAAKSAAAAAKWTRLIASAEVTKEYTALCRGLPPKQRGIFTSEVGKKGAIKSAATNYGVLKTAAQEDGFVFSLLRLTLETGRTHQIRIHLANAGCPIVGDDKYGDFQANRAIRKVYGIKKLQLAAVRLTVPLEGQKRTFTIPLPEHIQSAAELLFLV
ncbi:MAG: RluA family pseudouridine synthase, partial [Treponema sp.]|nr:RluA family pseudouridine synthase [Treponema sp.]